MAALTKPPHGAGREAILRATVSVVADRGLRGLTYRAVGERAGVNNSLIAHHFGSRDTLIAEALAMSVDELISSSGLGDPSRSWDEFLEAIEQSIATESELVAFQYEMIIEARRRPELAPFVRALYDRYESALVGTLASLGMTSVDGPTRRVLFGAIDGMVLQRVSGTLGPAEFRGAVERVLTIAESALGAPHADTV